MSVSAFVSRSKARSRSSREKRPASDLRRSRSPSPAISGSFTRAGSTETTSRSRTTRDIFSRNRRACERDHLIELALRVAHAAFGVARDQLERLLRDRDALGVDDA